MKLIIVLSILASHLLAAYPFYYCLRNNFMPKVSHFACVSVLIFYDVGLFAELFDYNILDPYFTAFFAADHAIQLKTLFVLLLAPWLFRIGSAVTSPRFQFEQERFNSSMGVNKRWLFYFVAISISVAFAVFGFQTFSQGESIWATRTEFASSWGPLIIIFYTPLHLLAFYVRQSDAATFRGKLLCLWLVIATVASTISIGQRTNVLVPILVFFLFRNKITLRKFILFSSITIIVASLLLPLFKWQHETGVPAGELIAATISTDVSRASLLTTVVEATATARVHQIVPYPLAGYVYDLFYYIPRSLAPYKGWATADYFTSFITFTPIDQLSWGFAFGAIEEVIINTGYWCFIPGLVIYGLILGLLDRISLIIPSLVVPTRLGAIWLCGYSSSSIFLTFVTMSIVGIICHIIFVNESTKLNLLKANL